MKIRFKYVTRQNHSILNRLLMIFIVVSSQISCKKLVEVTTPVTNTPENLVFSSDATAAAVLTGMYTNLSVYGFNYVGAPSSLSFFGGLSADELILLPGVSGEYLFYYSNSLSGVNAGDGYWGALYPKIFTTNSAIEGLSAATTLTPDVKSQLLGEAKFMRAFFYFYLVNLYGDVPLVLSTDYLRNAIMPRTPKLDVWEQIISDLKDAEILLSSEYLNADVLTPTPDRVRPSKWAASAFLSRVYLYTGKWNEAEQAATTVINNAALFDTVSLSDGVFRKISKEAIWQLQPVNTGWNTEDARFFVIPPTGPSGEHPVYLSDFFLNSFESGDNRKSAWIDSVTVSGITYFYPYKYQSATLDAPVTEYQMVFRLGELYLVRAEARAKMGNSTGAVTDLNLIRKRAGLGDYNGLTDEASLSAGILHERQVELFTEWGHRWLDLKRTGTIDAVMSIVTSQKGGTWNPNWQWYPISQTELQRNTFLVQNAGY